MTEVNGRKSPIKIPSNTVASYSDLGKHAQCRRAWYWGTYLKLAPVTEKLEGPLPFGSRIHQALEAYYDGTVAAPVDAWAPLMTHTYAVAEAQGSFTDGLDKESRLGHAMLEGYPDWLAENGEDSRFETVGVEAAMSQLLTLTVDMEEVTVLLRGKLDRRLRRKSDGAILAHDFKTTGQSIEVTIESLVRSPQPRVYLLLEKKTNPENYAPGFVITMLRKVLRTARATPPFYGRYEHLVSDAELDMYQLRLEGSISDLVATKRRLDRGEDPDRAAWFNPGWQCKSCPFKAPCSIRESSKAGSDDMLQDLFIESNPWERYLADPDREKDDELTTG